MDKVAMYKEEIYKEAAALGAPLKRALIGAGLGTGVGAGAGAVFSDDDGNREDFIKRVLTGAAIGAGTGGVAGFASGKLSQRPKKPFGQRIEDYMNSPKMEKRYKKWDERADKMMNNPEMERRFRRMEEELFGNNFK